MAQVGTSPDAARRTVERFNAANESCLELFAPTYVVREECAGNVRMRTIPLTFQYVFLRGSYDAVKRLCTAQNGFSFLIDRSSSEHRYAMISDQRMAHFRTIARAYSNCLPYFSLEDVDLEDGDEVEVVNGEFAGLIGTYIPTPRSKSGSIVLNVYNKVGTIAFNVRTSDVRVVRFSSRSTRANDQIDAFVPHLLAALRHYHAGEELPVALVAKLTMFCGRMGIVNISNRKLAARLQALLHVAFTLLGNVVEASRYRDRFEALKSCVTNRWTSALHELLFVVLSDSNDLRPRLNALLDQLPEPGSRTQQQLLAEIRHYLTGISDTKSS